jgi:hypothetical protein
MDSAEMEKKRAAAELYEAMRLFALRVLDGAEANPGESDILPEIITKLLGYYFS